MKWILELEEYQIMFYYRPGKLNVVADVLSRVSEPVAQEITWYERKKSLEQFKVKNTKLMTSRLELYDGEGEENESEEIVILWISACEEIDMVEFVADQENDETVRACPDPEMSKEGSSSAPTSDCKCCQDVMRVVGIWE